MPSPNPLGLHAFLTAVADFLETEPGGAPAGPGVLGTWPTNPPDPGRVAPDAVSAALQSALEATMVGKFARLRVAIVDFALAPPAVALWKPDEPVAIASMGKLAILYAAFQLREDVRAIARTFPAVRTAAEVETELRRAWATGTSTRLAGIANSPSIARLQFVFDFSPLAGSSRNANAIDFIAMRRCGIDDLRQDFPADSETIDVARGLEKLPHGENSASNWRAIADLTFAERLWMTTVWSDNVAASTCIWDVGLGYIQALLYDSGLFSNARSGLWLKRTFIETMPAGHGTRFGVSPSKFSPPVAGLRKQNGTARALAAFLIAIKQETLISAEACRQMKRLLRPLDRITVEGAGFPPDEYFGLASRIERAIPSGTIRRDVFHKGGLFPSDPDDPPFTTLCEWAALDLESAAGPSSLGLVVLGASSTLGDAEAREAAVEDLLKTFVQAVNQRFLL
jgi:hypothetical protein